MNAAKVNRFDEYHFADRLFSQFLRFSLSQYQAKKRPLERPFSKALRLNEIFHPFQWEYLNGCACRLCCNIHCFAWLERIGNTFFSFSGWFLNRFDFHQAWQRELPCAAFLDVSLNEAC